MGKGRSPVPREQRHCLYCGRLFYVGGRSGASTKRYCSKACVLKGKPSRNYGWRKKGLDAVKRPTQIDIAWAAGVYEGEGWCSMISKSTTTHAAVGQNDMWLLERLRALFGGSIYKPGNTRNRNYTWHVHGARAREFLMTINKHLSPHRQAQVKKVLG